jgi:hypothetical protein
VHQLHARQALRAPVAEGIDVDPLLGPDRSVNLQAGDYRATLVATDAAGNSSAKRRLAFTVVGG